MKLSEITTGQFQNYAPTPVESYAISKYLVADELFNIMEWESIGMGTGIGNLVASVLSYEEPPDAQGRKIGENFTPDNQVATPQYITLKILGGAFEADIVNKLAFSNAPGAVDNWVEGQAKLKMDAIKNTFAKWFLGGDSSVDDKQFDGMGKYFAKFTSQVNNTPLSIDGLSYTNALSVDRHFNDTIAVMNDIPDAIITTRLKGKPFLSTLEQHRSRGIKTINVGDKQYDTYMGIPIVGLPDKFWPTAYTDNGMPFMFIKFAEKNGIRCMLPLNVNPSIGSIIQGKMPNFDATGKPVNEGYLQMVTALAAVDPYVASLCYVKEKEAGGNG